MHYINSLSTFDSVPY